VFYHNVDRDLALSSTRTMITFEYPARTLHLRLVFGHGAYICFHIYVEQHSSSTIDRICRAESTSGPSILRTLGVKIPEL